MTDGPSSRTEPRRARVLEESPSLLTDPIGLSSAVERLEAVADRLEHLLAGQGRIDNREPLSAELPADVEARRQALRPAHVRILFITTAIFPDDTTNFYLADSHLYRCIRGAFIRALGPSVPQGEDFLRFFAEQGCWLYHVVPEPTRRPGRPRNEWVRGAVLALAEVLNVSSADSIVGLKARLRPRIVEAAERVRQQDRVSMVATPRSLWEPHFVAKLRRMLGVEVDPSGERFRDRGGEFDLVEAIQRALLERSNRRQRARDLVHFIEADNDYRPGSIGLKKAQISVTIRSRHDLFDVNSAGVRVRDGGDARGRRAATGSSRRI